MVFKFQCGICTRSFKQKVHLQTHLKKKNKCGPEVAEHDIPIIISPIVINNLQEQNAHVIETDTVLR